MLSCLEIKPSVKPLRQGSGQRVLAGPTEVRIHSLEKNDDDDGNVFFVNSAVSGQTTVHRDVKFCCIADEMGPKSLMRPTSRWYRTVQTTCCPVAKTSNPPYVQRVRESTVRSILVFLSCRHPSHSITVRSGNGRRDGSIDGCQKRKRDSRQRKYGHCRRNLFGGSSVSLCPHVMPTCIDTSIQYMHALPPHAHERPPWRRRAVQ